MSLAHRGVLFLDNAPDDAYRLTELGIFRARYAHLASWDIGGLLDELAGQRVSLPAIRQEFRQLLSAYQLSLQ